MSSIVSFYDEMINNIINNLLAYDTQDILIIINYLYCILITNVDGLQIIKDITDKLSKNKNINDSCKLNIGKVAAKNEYNVIRGRRQLIHLEAFIKEIIFILNKYNNPKNNILLKE